MKHSKKMAIIASYFAGENYGLLGPQMAATIVEDQTPYECIVVAVDRGDDKNLLRKGLADYFGSHEPLIGFSTLAGRQDLVSLAGELKREGATTILAGPQADTDFFGEKEWRSFPHRFQGFSGHFSFALHGPAEQMLPYLNSPGRNPPFDSPGFLLRTEDGVILSNPKHSWDESFLARVKWGNLFRLEQGSLREHRITTAQVLQQIGCPHASRPQQIEVAYPSLLQKDKPRHVPLTVRGCSFCDVAVDKGFHGVLKNERVLEQIAALPEADDGRKIAFELINENPLPGLSRILREAGERELRLSQVNLTMRADWLLKGEEHLREALTLARKMRVRVLLSSVGFESFDDEILKNLHKGSSVETNLRAVRLMRRLKELFPFQWSYSKGEGAVHGFIHPTPWDTPETAANIGRIIDNYRLSSDILPNHSVPLIIHHASSLADWIREVEQRENVRYERYGSVVGWWEEAVLKER
ncbi:MAG: radical SAM protein [Desulfobacteraceae bacterium]|nr:MAG: radical SAM protein [Desulfobacteraceae bacterium]